MAQTAIQITGPRLNDETQAWRDKVIAGLPTAARDTLLRAFERLHASNAGADAPGAGDPAPDFDLPNTRGGRRRLSEALTHGPVVLSFYRGSWCPFCNFELNALQRNLAKIRGYGGSLIAVSPETPDSAADWLTAKQLEFDVLADVGNHVARDYGLVMQVDPELRPLYHQWGIDLERANGDERWELPLPATYVIARDGRIHSAYVDKDYTRRMEPDDILAALRALAR